MPDTSGGPTEWLLDRLGALGGRFAEWSLNYVPDPYAIADLRAPDIVGYTTVAMVAGYVVVVATLTVGFGL